MSRIVIALGGNALGNTPEEQIKLTRITAKEIVEIVKLGHEVIISHGNGPQVGMINLGFEEAAKVNDKVPNIPFPECGAMSQGYIGYHLQNALINELRQANLNIPVATIITQVEVDINDPAFQNPTKPIGSFYDREASLKLEAKGYVMKEDAGRGYRRVVPSPQPQNIIEIDSIINLVNQKTIVISVGGGGIPVINANHQLVGVDAVIDKDKASATLSQLVNADIFLILTAVSHVMINYNKPNQENIKTITSQEIKIHMANNQFSKGSMLPKIEAAVSFLDNKPDGKVIITELGKATDALRGVVGTIITNKNGGK